MVKQTLNQPSNNISIENLRLKFPQERSLLFKDLSFHVSKGEKVLLLGPSGCGKSTLLQVLSGLIPDSIEVPLKYDNISLPESYGFVFQDPDTQFAMPYVDEELGFVLENLQIPRADMDRLIQSALKQVGLESVDPHTEINHLSQGMKQRLALAAVLLLQPEVLFLDEPSALLDPKGTVQIWDAVKRVASEQTVIIVEHKIDHIIDWVDRIVLFSQDGSIIANDSPETIFQKHLSKIIEYGIWYPDVWKDYIQSDRYQRLVQHGHQRLQEIPSCAKEVISLRDFSGYRGKERKIYVENLTLRSGSWVTILGDNGAGKSTLLLSLMHFIKTSGNYQLFGKRLDLREKKKQPPKQLSFVFQNPELQFITESIFDEIGYSLQLQGCSEETIRQT